MKLAHFVLISVATSLALALSILLVALELRVAAIAVAAVGFVAFTATLTVGSRSIPRDRVPTADYSRTVGRTMLIGSGLGFASAAMRFTLPSSLPGDLAVAAGFFWTLLALGTAYMGLGLLRSARLLRLVPDLAGPDGEPRAVALRANGAPGREPALVVVATDERIAWDEDGERYALAFDRVRDFQVDRGTATLTVAGDGRAVSVRPVARRELDEFERLLEA